MFGTSPKGAPKSKEFDDVYFSADDGLAESEYVFLGGNGLPRGWQDKERYVICETGFGTGLNFLAAWTRFEETTKAGQCLDFISFEKFPLDNEEIALHLQPWHDFFEHRLQVLLDNYPPLIPGFHRLQLTDRISLTLVFDDVNVAMEQLDARVDAWFLDGFKPSTNPEMWTQAVFSNMTRLSVKGARMSTFTAAGQVRRDVAAAGFKVEKKKGFGRKRDMTVGVFEGADSQQTGEAS